MASLIPEDLSAAGTHALVIGVSKYLHFGDGGDPTPNGEEFGMDQLTTAARSASEFAAWLLTDYHSQRAPLKSLRVLLSPSPGEQLAPAVTNLIPIPVEATLANAKEAIVAFRHACDARTDNVAIVYVAGHGVQLTKTGAILLLTDFGDLGHVARLEGALDMAGIHAGMNHPNTAQTQFWFVDACRQRPPIARRFESLEGALKLDVPIGSTQTSPMFLAAITGTEAFARPGGRTLFSEALLWALTKGAIEPPQAGTAVWHVPVTALIRVLPDQVQALANAEQADQSVDIAGKIHEATFQELPSAPRVDLRIEVDPEVARNVTRGTLKHGSGKLIARSISAWPFERPVDAGLYTLTIRTKKPFVSMSDILDVRPPAMTRGVRV
jgi:Caspase domain